MDVERDQYEEEEAATYLITRFERAYHAILEQELTAHRVDTPLAPWEHIEEPTPMPTTYTHRTNAPNFAEFYPTPIEKPPAMFVMQQNTHQIEIAALRERYPPETFEFNFQNTLMYELRIHRTTVREAIDILHRLQVARNAVNTAPPRFRQRMISILRNSNMFSDRNIQFISTPSEALTSHPHYRYTRDCIHLYRTQRALFLCFRETYSADQAEFNQRAAMIRQKPERTINLNRQEIVDTLSQWENVWGAQTYHDTLNNILYIRIGLCDIRMTDSAPESRFKEPPDILLAPFFITIKLQNNGKFVCASNDSQTMGLCRSDGALGWYIHPHQLSDAPCFGTFHQTFVDLAAMGDIPSLVGGLIAFYSQYNSEDSAGAQATRFHPTHLTRFEDPARYTRRLTDYFNRLGRGALIDSDKLTAAVERYVQYHAAEYCGTTPVMEDTHRCASCENTDVGDDGEEYWMNSNDDRICRSCWEGHYCGDCARHIENCECNEEME